ncbi:hypothetical protein B296_00007334 [Ensete ventricosum]|uniref:30S ribosomal protein S21 n=1 Tax=Ensete ventricosum TaxID=4639 RepID=A0A427BB94_ENSVE|nr:hypothetical protein B296_00007334 [Ensete ventricosum]
MQRGSYEPRNSRFGSPPVHENEKKTKKIGYLKYPCTVKIFTTVDEGFASSQCFLSSSAFLASNLLSLTRLFEPNSLSTSVVDGRRRRVINGEREREKRKAIGGRGRTFEADKAVEVANKEGVVRAEQLQVPHLLSVSTSASAAAAAIVGGGGGGARVGDGHDDGDVVAGVGGHDIAGREGTGGSLHPPVGVLDHRDRRRVRRLAIPHGRSMLSSPSLVTLSGGGLKEERRVVNPAAGIPCPHAAASVRRQHRLCFVGLEFASCCNFLLGFHRLKVYFPVQPPSSVMNRVVRQLSSSLAFLRPRSEPQLSGCSLGGGLGGWMGARGIRVAVRNGNLEQALGLMERKMRESGMERLIKQRVGYHLKNSEKRVLARKNLQHRLRSQDFSRKLRAIIVKKIRSATSPSLLMSSSIYLELDRTICIKKS